MQQAHAKEVEKAHLGRKFHRSDLPETDVDVHTRSQRRQPTCGVSDRGGHGRVGLGTPCRGCNQPVSQGGDEVRARRKRRARREGQVAPQGQNVEQRKQRARAVGVLEDHPRRDAAEADGLDTKVVDVALGTRRRPPAAAAATGAGRPCGGRAGGGATVAAAALPPRRAWKAPPMVDVGALRRPASARTMAPAVGSDRMMDEGSSVEQTHDE